MVTRTLGALATVTSCIQMVPQLYKTYTTRSVTDLSLYSLLLILLTNIFWALHGYFIADPSLLTAGFLTAAINATLILLYFKYQ
jgi:uncharacterized protein with PQ loop repeat